MNIPSLPSAKIWTERLVVIHRGIRRADLIGQVEIGIEGKRVAEFLRVESAHPLVVQHARAVAEIERHEGLQRAVVEPARESESVHIAARQLDGIVTQLVEGGRSFGAR